MKNKISTICIIISILCFSIFIHEFGHYTMSKELNVGVKEFSIGLGPKLYSMQKDETEYSLKLIPYGGSNKFYSKDKNDPIPNNKIYYKDISYDQQLLILLSGIAINFIVGFLCLIIFTFKLGIPETIDMNKKENESNKEYIDRINKSYLKMKYNKSNKLDSLKFIIKKIYNIFPTFLSYIKQNSTTTIIRKTPINGLSDMINIVSLLIQNNKLNIIFITGMLNIGLGFFNILPIPPLDGGKCVLLIINEIFGYNESFNSIFNLIGCLLVAFIISLDFKKDLGKIIFDRFKIKRKRKTFTNNNR